jgi:hypothetical protein
MEKTSQWSKDYFERESAYMKAMRARMAREIRDQCKEAYHAVNNFHFKKHAPKNTGLPTWNKHKQTPTQWVAPDQGNRNSSRLFVRSRGNALRYFKGKA